MREISLPAMLIFVNGQPQFSPKAGTPGAATAPLKRKRRPGSLPTASLRHHSMPSNFFCSDHNIGNACFRQSALKLSGRFPVRAACTLRSPFPC